MSKPTQLGVTDQMTFESLCSSVLVQVQECCNFAAIQLAYGCDGNWLCEEEGEVSYLKERSAQGMSD